MGQLCSSNWNTVVSGSEVQTVMIWDVPSHKAAKNIKLGGMVRSS